MIQIAICDDEKEILDEVSGYIKNYAEKKSDLDIEVFRFDSARTLISTLEDGKSFDVFVLDVYIGDEMGTTLARDIRKSGIESPIIFATTSLEHAPQSYETGTLRYLIKPINPRKFDEALDAALLQVKRTRDRFLKFKTENGVASVNANHIMYSESHDHYAPLLWYSVVLQGGAFMKDTIAELWHGNTLYVARKKERLTKKIFR